MVYSPTEKEGSDDEFVVIPHLSPLQELLESEHVAHLEELEKLKQGGSSDEVLTADSIRAVEAAIVELNELRKLVFERKDSNDSQF